MDLAEELDHKGFAIVPDFYSPTELSRILVCIASIDVQNDLVKKSKDVFAIRQVLKVGPNIVEQVFTSKLKAFLWRLFGSEYFIVKSIFFDKPELSNWYVSYHQDLTISVNEKIPGLPGFGPWTVKDQQFAVQPPLNILQNNFTIRIHLDDTDEGNGALRVQPGSHKMGIYRSDIQDWRAAEETICSVGEGGIMLMKPLLMHRSKRSTNNKRRRVLHIELSNMELPHPLKWSERIDLTYNIQT